MKKLIVVGLVLLFIITGIIGILLVKNSTEVNTSLTNNAEEDIASNENSAQNLIINDNTSDINDNKDSEKIENTTHADTQENTDAEISIQYQNDDAPEGYLRDEQSGLLIPSQDIGDPSFGDTTQPIDDKEWLYRSLRLITYEIDFREGRDCKIDHLVGFELYKSSTINYIYLYFDDNTSETVEMTMRGSEVKYNYSDYISTSNQQIIAESSDKSSISLADVETFINIYKQTYESQYKTIEEMEN
jgi:hypothetical protein